MTPDRWRLTETLYHSAKECAPSERAALLAQADPEIRREVQSLLRQDVSRTSTLDRPAWEGSAETATAAVEAGTQLGQYWIEAPLGEGGMEPVHRAGTLSRQPYGCGARSDAVSPGLLSSVAR